MWYDLTYYDTRITIALRRGGSGVSIAVKRLISLERNGNKKKKEKESFEAEEINDGA